MFSNCTLTPVHSLFCSIGPVQFCQTCSIMSDMFYSVGHVLLCRTCSVLFCRTYEYRKKTLLAHWVRRKIEVAVADRTGTPAKGGAGCIYKNKSMQQCGCDDAPGAKSKNPVFQQSGRGAMATRYGEEYIRSMSSKKKVHCTNVKTVYGQYIMNAALLASCISAVTTSYSNAPYT